MTSKTIDRLLTELEECRYQFDRAAVIRVESLLRSFASRQVRDPQSLIRLHEALLFLRAFPHSPRALKRTEELLNSFSKRVEKLRRHDVDLSSWDTFESSGVAGTAMEDTLSYDIVRWLIHHMPDKVEVAWDNFEPGREAGATWPTFMPLLADDAYVEADTPWRRWLEAARGRNKSGIEWLVRQFEALRVPDRDRAQLYDSLRLPVRWDLGSARVSRTRNWKRPASIFYHSGSLISRSQVSLAKELAKQPPVLTKVSRNEGERAMHAIREIMLVRYRELYGTTLGDPASVVRADMGRGTSIYLWNLPPERRLPLRAYVAGFTLKNGVPINYIESIGLCEWMEVGFNTFYTFRGGETAWLYSQVLRCLCHLMGTTCVSMYPYQLGHDNEEAIESGAFWFYRKLGFRPGRPELLRLVESEERKIAANPKYRTPARTLRRLAASHVFYELPGSEQGAWDRFSTRNIGLRVNAGLANRSGSKTHRKRADAAREVARLLSVKTASWSAADKINLENMAVVLLQVPDLSSWTRQEKDALVQLIRAKAARDEMKYLHYTQRHGRLRKALLRLGS